jgi:hypothetical protein
MTMLAILAASDGLTPTAKVIFAVVGLILLIAVICDNRSGDIGPSHY